MNQKKTVVSISSLLHDVSEDSRVLHEWLIDRQGYIRARWIPRAQQGWEKMAPFIATIETLHHEEPETADAEEHFH